MAREKRRAIRAAEESDLPLLAAMNRRLIEDEKSRNPMSVAELEDRMRAWMRGAYRIDLFLEEERVVGYAVHQLRADDYFPDRQTVYVRQFYIERGRRGRGLGSALFEVLAEARFPPEAVLTLEVLEANPEGRRFWERCGFEPYCTTLIRRGTA